MLTKQKEKAVPLVIKKAKNIKTMMPVSIEVLRMFANFRSIV